MEERWSYYRIYINLINICELVLRNNIHSSKHVKIKEKTSILRVYMQFTINVFTRENIKESLRTNLNNDEIESDSIFMYKSDITIWKYGCS